MHCDGHFYLLVSLLCIGVVFSFSGVLIPAELFWGGGFTITSRGKVYHMVSSRRKEKMFSLFIQCCWPCRMMFVIFVYFRLSYCAEHRDFMITRPF